MKKMQRKFKTCLKLYGCLLSPPNVYRLLIFGTFFSLSAVISGGFGLWMRTTVEGGKSGSEGGLRPTQTGAGLFGPPPKLSRPWAFPTKKIRRFALYLGYQKEAVPDCSGPCGQKQKKPNGIKLIPNPFHTRLHPTSAQKGTPPRWIWPQTQSGGTRCSNPQWRSRGLLEHRHGVPRPTRQSREAQERGA